MQRLVVSDSGVFQPTVFMRSFRIMMGPVNDSPPIVPFVFTVKHDGFADPWVLNSRGYVDVVCEENGDPAVERDNQTLVPGTVTVIFQYSDYAALLGDQQIALTRLEGLLDEAWARHSLPWDRRAARCRIGGIVAPGLKPHRHENEGHR